MNRIFVFLMLVSMACNKSHAPEVGLSITGTWKMVKVEDNATGLVTTNPPTLNGNVIITFSSTTATTGKLWGNTPTNRIDPSDYLLGTNQGLIIPALQMTKVAETPWGAAFVDHITAAKKYSLATGLLEITTTQKTLRFKKQ